MNSELHASSGHSPESQQRTSSPAAAPERLVWVEAARGVAILWIMGLHFLSIWGPPPAFKDYLGELISPHAAFTERFVNLLMAGFRVGWQGVDIFIVLSGFVLTMSYLSATRDRPYFSWLARRAARIYPAYWAAIAGTIVMWSWSFRSMSFDWSQAPQPFDIVMHALGLHVLLKSTFSSICPAWWFIGLILQLYLVFPLMVRALVRIGTGKFLCAALAFYVLTRLAIPRIAAGSEGIEYKGFFGYYTIQFAVGMVLARAWGSGHAEPLLTRIIEQQAIPIAVYALWIIAKYFGFSAFVPVPLATTAIALICINTLRRLKGGVLVAALARIGTYSYELYLIHAPLQIRIMGPPSQQSLAEASGRLALHILALCIGAVLLKRLGAFASLRLLKTRDLRKVARKLASEPSRDDDGRSPGNEPAVQYPEL